jgi:hypothetical protein
MPSDPLKLSEVDELVRADHFHLRADDECLFLREYTSRVGYAHSETNSLISNLKKPPSRRANTTEWKWKGRAIRQAGTELADAFARGWSLGEDDLLVPVPPSLTRGHAEYDDRMVQVANILGSKLGNKVVELLEAGKDRVAQHATDKKRSVQEHVNNLRVRVDLLPASPPTAILLLDDVLVTGCTFVACKTVLQTAFPNVAVYGLYVARRRPLDEGIDDGAGDE